MVEILVQIQITSGTVRGENDERIECIDPLDGHGNKKAIRVEIECECDDENGTGCKTNQGKRKCPETVGTRVPLTNIVRNDNEQNDVETQSEKSFLVAGCKVSVDQDLG